jgi:hypothetical protein
MHVNQCAMALVELRIQSLPVTIYPYGSFKEVRV